MLIERGLKKRDILTANLPSSSPFSFASAGRRSSLLNNINSAWLGRTVTSANAPHYRPSRSLPLNVAHPCWTISTAPGWYWDERQVFHWQGRTSGLARTNIRPGKDERWAWLGQTLGLAGASIGPGRGEHYYGEDERWCGEGKRWCDESERRCDEGERWCGEGKRRCGEGERWCGEGERSVAMANDGVAKTNDGVGGRTTLWRARTSKLYKKEIMSLLSFHTIHV